MLKKRINSFRYAFVGIVDLFRSEVNAWIHGLAAIGAIIAGFFFAISPIEWCLVTFAIVLVIGAEAINTSIESLTDLVSPEHHELARKTKDTAAAGVLIMAIGAAIVGFIVFVPKFISLFFL